MQRGLLLPGSLENLGTVVWWYGALRLLRYLGRTAISLEEKDEGWGYL